MLKASKSAVSSFRQGGIHPLVMVGVSGFGTLTLVLGIVLTVHHALQHGATSDVASVAQFDSSSDNRTGCLPIGSRDRPLSNWRVGSVALQVLTILRIDQIKSTSAVVSLGTLK